MRRFIGNDWDDRLQGAFQTESYEALRQFLKEEYENETIYPPMEDIWNAFRLTPYDEVKVVILGQDPYHGAGQAHGLSFSVREGVKVPPSVRNMKKELETDLGIPYEPTGNLEGWARQGVLLLNTVLTVREGKPHSHKNKGWEQLTDTVIRALNDAPRPIVFLLWGNPARAKKSLIDTSRHAIIESTHPSPFSARNGFFGSRPYSRTNEWLTEWGEEPIDWKKQTASDCE